MDRFRELEDMLCDEIDRIIDQKNLTGSSLDALDKLTHSLKSVKAIVAMDGYDYSRGRDRSSGRYERRY